MFCYQASFRGSLCPALIQPALLFRSLSGFASRIAAIELTAFEHISRRTIPGHLLGLEISPGFGRIVKTTCFQISVLKPGQSEIA
jgi:hypothetical protein